MWPDRRAYSALPPTNSNITAVPNGRNAGAATLIVLSGSVAVMFLIASYSNAVGTAVYIACAALLLFAKFPRRIHSAGGVSLAIAAATVFALSVLPSVTPLSVRGEEALKITSYFLLFVALIRLPSGSAASAPWIVSLAILATLPLYLAFGWFSGAGEGWRERFAGPFLHANHLAYALAFLGTYVSVAVFRDQKPSRWLWVRAALLVALIVALLMSRSSGGLVAMVLGVGAVLLERRGLTRKIIAIALGVVVLVLIASTTEVVAELVRKLTSVDLEDVRRRALALRFGGGDGSFVWRLSYWTAIINAHLDTGFINVLFGSGGGATTKGNYVFAFMNKDAHSDFVKLFVEYGFVGLTIIVLCILSLPFAVRGGWKLFLPLFVSLFSGNTIGSVAVFGIFLLSLVAIYHIEDGGSGGPVTRQTGRR